MKRMFFDRDDDGTLYVEVMYGVFKRYDELPVDMIESDGKLNVMLNSCYDVPLFVNPGYTTFLKLRKEGYKLVGGRERL